MTAIEEPPNDMPGFLARRPTLQYILLAAIGVFGIYLAMPIALDPQSSVAWFDLVINIVILVPSCVLVLAGAILALLSGFSPRVMPAESRPARFTRIILRTVGIPRSLIPGAAALGPLGLLLEIFWNKYREQPAPEESDPDEPSR